MFLQPEQTLVFKVDVGWRYIVVCHCVFHKSPLSLHRSLLSLYQAGGLVSNSDTGRNIKDEETFVYESPSFSNRDYKWK